MSDKEFNIEKAWKYHYYIILTFLDRKPSVDLYNQVIEETGGHLFHINDSNNLWTCIYIVYPFLWDLEGQKEVLQNFADKHEIKVAIECPKLV